MQMQSVVVLVAACVVLLSSSSCMSVRENNQKTIEKGSPTTGQAVSYCSREEVDLHSHVPIVSFFQF